MVIGNSSTFNLQFAVWMMSTTFGSMVICHQNKFEIIILQLAIVIYYWITKTHISNLNSISNPKFWSWNENRKSKKSNGRSGSGCLFWCKYSIQYHINTFFPKTGIFDFSGKYHFYMLANGNQLKLKLLQRKTGKKYNGQNEQWQ